ncbi:MAG: AmmeMemoRadiSam system protein B, partial [Candidatus Magasanikbacteria bacterium]|nr:AmmeMemoRadiSam system protein B [Candidatus Magasanikbacteria bacterium]
MMAPTNLRKPVVAGQFYPDKKEELKDLIASFVGKTVHKTDVLGAILPHAGYVYSGRVAVETVSGINIKDTVVLLGPNHTDLGSTFSIMPQGTWQTPLGNVEVDARLAKLFLEKSKYLEADLIAHLNEHSLEVQLPILQFFRSNFKIVPIALKTDNLSMLTEVAQNIADVISENNLQSSVLFIASSDMTHYESLANAKKKDALAIEAIVALDEQKLDAVVKEFDISM